jgi:hypothetical protein
MGRFLMLAVLSCVAFVQSAPPADSNPAQSEGAHSSSSTASASPSAVSRTASLPPTPAGKSTVIGGEIRGVDVVRDQFTMSVFGGRTLKVLYDERTLVFRDGLKSALSGLRTGDHVSVETVLDGTTVFARSIRLLSVALEGELQGQVMSYDPVERELTVRDTLSRRPVRLRVTTETAITRQGQAATSSPIIGPSDLTASDLAAGTLLSVKFRSDNKSYGTASEISILAAPGSTFVFAGNVVFLDLHSGRLAVVDPRDDRRYDVFFDSKRLLVSRDLHEGSNVTLSADFDGARYVATAITIQPDSDK